MREWFLSTELIGLDTMPGSIAGISQKAKRENWKSRKAKGGGRSLEYHISNFDVDIQSQLLEKQSDSDRDSNLTPYEILSKLDKHSEMNKDLLTHKENNSKYVELDFYDLDVSAASNTLVIQKGKENKIGFTKNFITNEIGVNAENVFLMPVRGDSMYPSLKNQAIIMVNKIGHFSSDGIYVFRFDGQLMIKRLQFTKAGLNVISDNATYEPWQVTHEELATKDFEIIGEVVWSGQRM